MIDYKKELTDLVEAAKKYSTAWACHHKEWNAALKKARNALNAHTEPCTDDWHHNV